MTTEAERPITLYHGTTAASAELLTLHGWKPHAFPGGNHCGNPGLLYLTTDRENALWYANEKGDDVVVAVELPTSALLLDPEDAVGETVAEEFEISSRTGLPANFATAAPVAADRISLSVTAPRPRP